jgi:hypothetical protein
MKIKELQPKRIVTKNGPQCCAVVDQGVARNEYWLRIRKRNAEKNGRGWLAEQCQQFGTVMIDEKLYCRKHAGVLALDMWLEGKLVERQSLISDVSAEEIKQFLRT